MKKEFTHQHPDAKTKEDIIVRLNRIEGQIRGIIKMIERDVYCEEILHQIASVKSALNGARNVIFRDHVQHCIADKMTINRLAATEELMSIIKKIS